MRRAVILAALCLPLAAQSDPKERVKNIGELEKQGAGALPELAGYLKDSDDEVRREAVKSIVAVGTQKSLDPLVEAARDNDEEIQIRAADGLVNFYYPGYVQSGLSGSIKRIGRGIKGKFTDTNDQVIAGYLEPREDVVAAIAHQIANGASLTAKANAARAAGVLRARATTPQLLDALRSKDTTLMYESLVAIQKIREPKTAEGIRFLLLDPNEKVQLTAIETTGLLRNRDALPGLREALDRSKKDKVRAAALSAIAMVPDEGNRYLFDTFIKDRDDDMRAGAAEGYARLKTPSDAEKLRLLFADEKKMKPRLAMAFALVNLDHREISEFSPLQYLINTLNSSSWQGIAAAYLRELCYEKAVREGLYAVINQRTKDEKIHLAEILARSGDEATVPVIENLTRDADVEVGQVAARELRILRGRLP
ncbi:MAG: HEAT repeat domain-containing protein [Bryobacteraceae bacterium]